MYKAFYAYKKWVSFVVALFVLLIPLSPLSAPDANAGREEDAVASFAGCAAAAAVVWALNKIPNIEVKTSTASDWKETLLDCAAWALNNLFLDYIVTEVINWVNTGFGGGTAYVQDIRRHFGQVADIAGLEFIELGENLEFLCEPYRLETQISLSLDVGDPYGTQRGRCTLADVTNNIDGFLSGDFRSGGWAAWFELTTNPYSNPYGSYLIAKNAKDLYVADAVDAKEKELEYGDGILSYKKCEQVPAGVGPLGLPLFLEQCEIVTPGRVIQEQLNKVLAIGNERTVQADELSEVLTEIFTRLISDLLTGDGGGLQGFDRDRFGTNLPTIPDLPLPGGVCPVDDPQGSQVINLTLLTEGQEEEQYVVPGVGEPQKDKRFVLPLEDAHYSTMTLDFDFFLNQINPLTPHNFQPIFNIRNEGSGRIPPDPQLLLAIGIRDNQDKLFFWTPNENAGDMVQKAGNASWSKQTWYHFNMVYDANLNSAVVTVTNRDTKAIVARVSNDALWSLFPQKNGMRLIIGDENLDENVEHLAGSIYENIEVTLEPGGPVCDGVNFTDGGGSTDIPDVPSPSF